MNFPLFISDLVPYGTLGSMRVADLLGGGCEVRGSRMRWWHLNLFFVGFAGEMWMGSCLCGNLRT